MVDNVFRVALARLADRPVIEQLLQPYLRELSIYRGVGASDAVAYPYLDLYWQELDRRPFLISAGDRVAGFALVNTWAPSGRPVDRAMAEFYVVPDCRRAGVGARAAAEIIDSLPGSWEIGISASHDAARAFWAHVVRRIPGALPHWSEGDGERWAGPILNFRAAGWRG
jgi:predicted acetyltransferase